MTDGAETPVDPRDLVSLKRREPEVDPSDPWHDDVLERRDIADRLTPLIQNQTEPFVISLHGAWGTGKTFMLRRWRQDLENQGYQAIYFNAWEEDFSDDPLLTIVGQMFQYFDNPSLLDGAKEVGRVASILLARNLKSVANKFTGSTLDTDGLDNWDQGLVAKYLELHKVKDDFKDKLADLSARVLEETGHPLVFIIDELDRCRPTFAVELLERVKHIFDVNNIVFVLGINRDELCKSLKSVYGEIEADTYVRRFFDMEFNLPTANAEAFGQHLLEVYGLKAFARELAGRRKEPHLADDLIHFERSIPTIWAGLGLSLRDIDYSVRLTVLMCMLRPTSYTYPHLLGVLVAVKNTNSQLFQEFVRGDRRGSEVMDYVDNLIPPSHPRSDLSTYLASLECLLYFGDYRGSDDSFGDISVQVPALQQLRLFANGDELTQPQYLSKRTQHGPRDSDKVRYLEGRLSAFCSPNLDNAPRNIVRYLANLIDLGGGLLRR